MKSNFKYDLFRYYGNEKISIKEKIFMLPEIKYLYFFRKVKEAKNPIMKTYYKIRLRIKSNQTQIQIPWGTKIGKGFYIGHFGRIIINEAVIIGNNVNIATGVTIGQESRGKRKGTPTIGNEVWIGTNAVVVGNIKIGNNVLIAPLSYVNFDVPDNSIVIGNPAKIIEKINATQEYIVNVILN